VTTSLGTTTPDPTLRPEALVCTLCGTRLQLATDTADIDADALATIATHRCVPRVATQTH
jgi:hypothetical protein